MTISELADETGHSESYIVKQMQEAGMLRAKKSKDVSDQTINSSYEDELEDRGGDIYWDGRSSIDEEIRGMVNVINRDDDDEDDEDECDEVAEGNDDEEDYESKIENDVSGLDIDGSFVDEIADSFKSLYRYLLEDSNGYVSDGLTPSEAYKVVTSSYSVVEQAAGEGHTLSYLEKLASCDYLNQSPYEEMDSDDIKEDLKKTYDSYSEEAIEYVVDCFDVDVLWEEPARIARCFEIYDEAKEKANNHFSDESLVQWYVETCVAKETVLDFNDKLESYFEDYGPWQCGGPDGSECTLGELLDDYYSSGSWTRPYVYPEVTYNDPFLEFGDSVYYSKFLDEQLENAFMPSDERPDAEDPDDEIAPDKKPCGGADCVSFIRSFGGNPECPSEGICNRCGFEGPMCDYLSSSSEEDDDG